MKVLQLIAVHAAAQECFDRHVPIWKANRVDNLVACPVGESVDTDWEHFEIGESSRYGLSNTERWIDLLRFLYGHPQYGAYVLQDYDAICLRSEIPIPPLFGSTFQTNVDPLFRARSYPHSPMIFSRKGLGMILNNAHKIPIQHGNHDAQFFDRWLGLLCERLGLQITNHDALGWGYTRNTIEDHQIQEAVDRARNGSFLFHGVKTKPVLDRIVEAYRAHELANASPK